MTDVLVAAFVAAVVSLIVVLLTKQKSDGTVDESFGKPFDVASALIVIYPDPVIDGKTLAKVFPYRLQAKKKWDVEWIILDPTGATATKDVEIRWVADDPLEGPVKGKKRIKS